MNFNTCDSVSLKTLFLKRINFKSDKLNIDIDSINQRLQNGDKSALQELDNNNIQYTFVNTSKGYVVTYSYDNNDYKITYENTVDEKPTKSSVLNDYINNQVSNIKSRFHNVDDNSSSSYPDRYNDFDYSVVPNLDTNISEYGVTSRELKLSSLGVTPKDGSYAKLLSDVANIKPQFATYMKTKMHEKGFTLSDSEIDKSLNMFISLATRDAVTDAISFNSMNQASFFGETKKTMSTVQDILNCIVDMIDNYDYSDLKIKLDNDEFLLDTEPLFLTDDEKITRQIVKLENSRTMTLSSDNKDEVERYINSNAEHLKKVLKQKYPDLSEFHVNKLTQAYTEKCLEQIDNFKNGDGTYDLSGILRSMTSSVLAQAKIMEKMDKS